MDKKYLAKIIANDNEGLQIISACCAGAKVKISNIKYLQSNKIFLLLIETSKFLILNILITLHYLLMLIP